MEFYLKKIQNYNVHSMLQTYILVSCYIHEAPIQDIKFVEIIVFNTKDYKAITTMIFNM